jgi:uncharacterized protein YkwD
MDGHYSFVCRHFSLMYAFPSFLIIWSRIFMNKKFILPIIASFLLLGCGGGGSTSSAPAQTSANSAPATPAAPTPYPNTPYLSDTEKQAFLDAINHARAVDQDCGKKGIKAATTDLQWSDALYSAAYEHSQDMAESDTFAHEGSGTSSDWTGYDPGKKSTVVERIENNGYGKWKYLGENIAAGIAMDTAQIAVNAWIDSDEHCANLMNPDFKEVGMAMARNDRSAYTHYWTQDFAAKQ